MEPQGINRIAKDEIRSRYKGVDKSLLKVIPAKNADEFRGYKRVAVYARVSTKYIGQTTSYELQKNYYTELVNNHEGWELVDIYADEGFSATSMKHREEFNRMVCDCEARKVDIIITKSISRFSRNIIDCIKTVRKLHALQNPVEVIFEVEDIHTFDSSTEMKLSFLAAVAQEESRNKSVAITASIEQRFARGMFLHQELYGYTMDKEWRFMINEKEADIVRLVFYLRILGYTVIEIAEKLDKYGVPSIKGYSYWRPTQIQRIILNEKYNGDFLARKYFTYDFLGRKRKKNNNERSKYLARDHHPQIVSKKIYEVANTLMQKGNCSRTKKVLPELQVVPKGILKGYVPLDFYYDYYSFEEHYNASCSAYKENEKNNTSITDYKSGDRVKVKKRQLVPSLILHKKSFILNVACITVFRDFPYIEILVNFRTGKIALRPSEERRIFSFSWRRKQEVEAEKLSLFSMSKCSLLHKLVKEPGRDKYMIPGEYYEKDGQKLLIFDINQAMADRSSHKLLQSPTMPCYYDGYNSDEDVLASDYYEAAVTVAGTELLTVTEMETIKKEVQRILKDRGVEDQPWINRP